MRDSVKIVEVGVGTTPASRQMVPPPDNIESHAEVQEEDKAEEEVSKKQMSMQVKVEADEKALVEGMDMAKNMTEVGDQLSMGEETNCAEVSKVVTADQSFRKQIEDSRFNRTIGQFYNASP